MKKIISILVFISLVFIKFNTFAIEACDRLVPQYANFVGKVVMGSNLRSYPCTYKSTVLWVLKIWDKYNVISKVDWWYQIQTNDWKKYRIWDRAISKTNDIIIKKEQKVEKIDEYAYKLKAKDNLIINKFVSKVDKVVQKKWLGYRDSLIIRIEWILNKKKYSNRLTSILKELIYKIWKIEFFIEKEKIIIKEKKVNITNIQKYSYNLKNININKVKNTWLWWYNNVRKSNWLKPYSYDSRLESSAIEWSILAKNRWNISHKRDLKDDYYDYNKITSWFKDIGVVCKNIYRATNTENIWYGSFKCNDWECSEELIKGIRSTFDFYMWEKGKDYDIHYKSIIHKYFTKIWLWIELEDKWNWYYKYYLTVHFCTELI